ncbi:receptor-like protein 9DC3 [Syzygium oleosum]|uniref:receptor-like protein 9DC3 n=1 Tax=Syzygium oleosum TaxID=219896 RepID=UPI0024B9F754|nr:receptor-like protein 9DC3 [Syzygium oleosum]
MRSGAKNPIRRRSLGTAIAEERGRSVITGTSPEAQGGGGGGTNGAAEEEEEEDDRGGARKEVAFCGYLYRLSIGSCNFSGSLPSSLGNLSQLAYLDIASDIWHWLVNLAKLTYCDLSDVQLSGPIPSSFENLTRMVGFDLSYNNLQGEIPKSLWELKDLEYMDLRRNNLSGTVDLHKLKNLKKLVLDFNSISFVSKTEFNASLPKLYKSQSNSRQVPPWLSELTELKAIILKSNKFHGPIKTYQSQFNFSNLHVMDLSSNSFDGELPSKLLQSFHAMKIIVSQDRLEYMNVLLDAKAKWFDIVTYGMKLLNKGTKREYSKVPYALMGIDLSNNKFEGCIPNLIGDLKSLLTLNLSNNILIGSIPPSLAKLTMLESLDLSRNKLSGELPRQLTQLTFLSSFDVSHNQLSGLVPRGSQFDTFRTGSFSMNNGLCGIPLPNKCTEDGDNLPLPPSLLEEGNGEESPLDLDWKVVLIGSRVGFLIGVVLGNWIIDVKSSWFLHYSKKMAKRWKRLGRH